MLITFHFHLLIKAGTGRIGSETSGVATHLIVKRNVYSTKIYIIYVYRVVYIWRSVIVDLRISRYPAEIGTREMRDREVKNETRSDAKLAQS